MGALVEMTVDSVRLHAPTHQHVVVLKERRGRRYLPVWSNVVEANAVSLMLQGRTFERPLTHDLLGSVIEQVGITVRRVVIAAPAPADNRAWIEATVGGRHLVVDARPADALAVAMRRHAPICVAAEVLDEDGILRPDGSSPEDDRLANLRDIVNSMDLPALESDPPMTDL